MKTISKTITSISLCLLTAGIMAQTPGVIKTQHLTATPIKGKLAPVKHEGRRITSTPNYQLSNLLGDELNSGGTFYNWQPYLYLNSDFTDADTLTPYNCNTITTVFDSAFDVYSQSYVSISSMLVGQMAQVDTITAYVRYYNSSGNNDTIFLSVNSVDANGFPSTTVYGVDTVVIFPGFFLYNEIDSIQEFYVVKTINIPTTARHGWNFCVQMTSHCDKTMDTIGLYYTSSGTNNCTSFGYYYTPEPTVVGVPNGVINCVNTFGTGYWQYNDLAAHGNNTMLSLPLTSGTYQGYYMNPATYYWAPLALTDIGYSACPGDTIQWSIQDVALFPSISIVSVTTGNNNMNTAGLFVGQNYPNPFNKTTQIMYSLVKSANVTFSVYDMTGRVLVNNVYTNSGTGEHTINLDANSFSPGVYFYTFDVNGSKVTKKMVITE